MGKIQPSTLTGVSETALWTLWNRGVEAARPDALFNDPVAKELIDRIDYPYRERFGVPQQAFVIRAMAFDAVVREYLRENPSAAVVALGEGLQTSYWRLGSPQSPWITVDLAPVITLRELLLPHEEHVVNVTGSIFDLSWMDIVPARVPPLITAEGLFMYFGETAVLELIRDCAARFPGGRLVFDAVPEWWRRRKNKTPGAKADASTKQKLVVPSMSSTMSAKDAARLPRQVPGVSWVREVQIPRGRGLAGVVQRLFYHGRVIPSQWRGSLCELGFAD